MKEFTDTQKLIQRYRENIVLEARPTEKSSVFQDKLFDIRTCLTIAEVAVYLGISVKSVERAIKRGDIQAKKLGRRWLVPRGAIETWLNRKD